MLDFFLFLFPCTSYQIYYTIKVINRPIKSMKSSEEQNYATFDIQANTDNVSNMSVDCLH